MNKLVNGLIGGTFMAEEEFVLSAARRGTAGRVETCFSACAVSFVATSGISFALSCFVFSGFILNVVCVMAVRSGLDSVAHCGIFAFPAVNPPNQISRDFRSSSNLTAIQLVEPRCEFNILWEDARTLVRSARKCAWL